MSLDSRSAVNTRNATPLSKFGPSVHSADKLKPGQTADHEKYWTDQEMLKMTTLESLVCTTY